MGVEPQEGMESGLSYPDVLGQMKQGIIELESASPCKNEGN